MISSLLGFTHVLACAACMAAPVPSWAEDPRASMAAGLEPPWAKDTSIATSRVARAELERGDAAWNGLGAHPATVAELAPAFEAWRRALALSEPGELVEGGAPGVLDPSVHDARDARPSDSVSARASSLARRVESVEIAVLRRIELLETTEQRAWSERFAPAAEDARLAAFPDQRGMARVERDWPATPAAARAALALGDPWFERGEFDLARLAWLRASEHLRPRAASPSGASTATDELRSKIESALEQRHARLSQVLATRVTRHPASQDDRLLDAGTQSFAHARAIELVAEIEIAPTKRRLGQGLVPGMTAIDGSTMLLQSGETVATLSSSGELTVLDIEGLAEAAHVAWHPAFRDRDGVWKQQPAADGTTAVLVLGRAREQSGNALICLENVGAATRVRWAWSAEIVTRADGTTTELAAVLGAGLCEFQPGPCLVGGQALVHVRQFGRDREGVAAPGVDEAAIESRLVAIDLASGSLRWVVTLAKGSDGRAGERERMMGGIGVTLPPPPLELARCRRDGLPTTEESRSTNEAAAGPSAASSPFDAPAFASSVFVDTCLAVGFAVDALDGRVLFGVRVPRAADAADERPFLGTLDAREPSGWRWRPQGAHGFVYALSAGADLDVGGLFLATPTQPLALVEISRGGRPDSLVGFATTLPGRIAVSEWPTLDSTPRSHASSPRPRAGARAIVHDGQHALAVAGGEIALYELSPTSTLLAALRLPALDEEPEVALEVSGDVARIVGRQRAWVLQLR